MKSFSLTLISFSESERSKMNEVDEWGFLRGGSKVMSGFFNLEMVQNKEALWTYLQFIGQVLSHERFTYSLSLYISLSLFRYICVYTYIYISEVIFWIVLKKLLPTLWVCPLHPYRYFCLVLQIQLMGCKKSCTSTISNFYKALHMNIIKFVILLLFH